MEQYVFLAFWVAVFIAQAALCLFSKRVIIKLIPVLALLVLMGACIIIYLATQNWAYLILLVIVFFGLLVAGAVWALCGVVKLTKIIAGLSRKNT